jgi:hypothetical protein
VQASTTANSAVPNQLPLTTTSTPLASSTNTRVGSGGDGTLFNRSAPDRKTINSTFPSRQHPSASANPDYRASIRNPMGSSDGHSRHQQSADSASNMIGGTGSGAQSFLSKLSSKFARR